MSEVNTLLRKVLPFLWLFIFMINIAFAIYAYNLYNSWITMIPNLGLAGYALFELSKSLINLVKKKENPRRKGDSSINNLGRRR